MSKAKIKVKKKFIPKALQKHRRWVVWDYKLDKNGKLTKVPINPKTEKNAAVNNPQTWGVALIMLRCYR
jgi:primase-polymerase (primpol)-like protein